MTTNGIRLPASIRPRRYALTLTPDLTDFTFQGEEAIALEVAEATTHITLHASELDIASCEVTLADGTALPAADIHLDADAETARFSFGQPIPAGSVTLHLRFAGTLNDQLRGFYRSRYTSPDGATRYLAATQFEATDARRAFPCWDEPAVKATFQVTLVVPTDLTAISNMPVESETPVGPGRKAVRFAETPRMSTYLLAFIVGDMVSSAATAPGGTLVRVWTTRGKEAQGRFALENAVRVLSYFNNYFGIPYPLPKLDHIAIPDFAAGAMENWGAVTYRETALLYDPEHSAAATRQRILEVVAHETAHMWFGDLVTMEWWDDLWLNESFASWIGDKCVDALYPEWHMWTQFVSHDTNAGLGLDGLRNSHPVEVPVANPAQIREIFDAISYSKGGSVLRMLEEYLGAETFCRGLQAYLTAHQYGNARTEDLWTALAAASGEPVSEVMGTWIKQVGYPFVQARVDRHDGQLWLHLAQRRFLYDHLLDERQDDPTLWKIPVSVTRQGLAEKLAFLMEEREHEVNLGGNAAGAQGWVKVNGGQTGFYRVQYGDTGWDRLREAVRRLDLPAVDRLGLQNDAYALARAGYAPATRFLSLAEAYENEQDAIVWGDLSANLNGLEVLVLHEPFLPAFDAFARRLYQKIVQQVGWEARPGEGHLDTLLRSTVLAQAGAFGDPAVLQEAQARFARYLQHPASLHPDLRGVVVALAAQQGDRDLYEAMWERARQTEFQEEKLRFLRALTRFPQRDLLQTTLERSLSPDVRSQDTITIVVSVAANRRDGRALAWEFVQANWPEFDRRYGRGGASITSLVALTGGFTTLERAREVEEFFRTHPVPAARRTVEQSLERIRLNAAWLERNRASLAAWFSGSGAAP
ncbi:MAG: M1 family metallopeptidase [Chloroflexi bacterium]|nr:M1 family metallopeptidase [Chloroflexota bacterium]